MPVYVYSNAIFGKITSKRQSNITTEKGYEVYVTVWGEPTVTLNVNGVEGRAAVVSMLNAPLESIATALVVLLLA